MAIDNSRFINRAIELSRTHMLMDEGGPFGAVIVRDGQIIAEGWNQVTSTNDPTAHAEVVAIRRACQELGNFELRGAELYTSCEPCPMCLAAVYWARLERIYFACTREDAARHQFDDELIYREIAKSRDERLIPIVQTGREQAYRVFLEWDRKLDKIIY